MLRMRQPRIEAMAKAQHRAGSRRKPAPKSPADLTASEASAAIRSGSLSSEALVAACLDRISALEPEIKAWAFLDREHALTQARNADAWAREGKGTGPLHGVPVGIKDIIDSAD